MSRNKGILLLVLLVNFTACMNKPTVATYDATAENAKVQFDRAMHDLDGSHYAEAAKTLQKILVQRPATEFDFVVQFNLGAAHEGLKACHEAIEDYRAVARGASQRFPRLEAVALLRLSYSYECTGQDSKALVALLDARQRAKELPDDTARAELPARIAAAYARSGNRKEAEKFFKIALGGIKYLQVKYKDSRSLADTLAETLFFMGRSVVSEKEFLRNPVGQIRGLALMQLYLLQSAEIGSAKWSGKAVDEIMQNYERIWLFTSKVEADDEDEVVLKQRKSSGLRAEVFKEALRSVKIMRAQRLPTRDESADIRRLFTRLIDEEKKLTAAYVELSPGTNLTPQAESRQGLRAQGKVKSSEDSELEKEAKKKVKK